MSRRTRIALLIGCAVVGLFSLISALTGHPYMLGTFIAMVLVGAGNVATLRREQRSDDTANSSPGNGTST